MRRSIMTAALLLLTAVPGVAQGPEVGGGIYLFRYQPVDLEGVDAYNEIYAAYATLDYQRGRWSAHLEGRARDSRLRPFFRNTVWLQQGWLGMDLLPDSAGSRLRLRGGKMYAALGRFWDGSFFGNIHYFDGLKLNPQYAIAADGRLAAGPAELGYELQYVARSDRVSGAIQGRAFETLRGARDQEGWIARGTAALPEGLALGASLASLGMRVESDGSSAGAYRVPLLALDAEWGRGPITLYTEWTRRGGGNLPVQLREDVPGSAATYWLAGAQVGRGRLHLRYNFSRGAYDDLARREWIHQPGVTLDLLSGAAVLLEYDLWRVRTDAESTTADRSLNLVLHLSGP